jgi:hypothetical protein
MVDLNHMLFDELFDFEACKVVLSIDHLISKDWHDIDPLSDENNHLIYINTTEIRRIIYHLYILILKRWKATTFPFRIYNKKKQRFNFRID